MAECWLICWPNIILGHAQRYRPGAKKLPCISSDDDPLASLATLKWYEDTWSYSCCCLFTSFMDGTCSINSFSPIYASQHAGGIQILSGLGRSSFLNVRWGSQKFFFLGVAAAPSMESLRWFLNGGNYPGTLPMSCKDVILSSTRCRVATGPWQMNQNRSWGKETTKCP
jgi:hypothetical protein